MKYSEMPKSELSALRDQLNEQCRAYAARGLSLDLSRGKPGADQLDRLSDLLGALSPADCVSEDGVDCRNYGVAEGLPELRRLFADLLGLDAETILIGGNSSLEMMFDALCRAMLFGTPNSVRPWCMERGLKWICVTPGYDRHFAITEKLGFTLLSVPMREDGPDMDAVERLVRDPSVKGIWCVPKYSNPTGNTYSDETVRRLARMECAAPDFRIVWDNAYAVHDLYDRGDRLLDIFAEARAVGHEDRILYFASTSKITLPGSGVAMMAASRKNYEDARKTIAIQTICADKINQLRHVRFLKDARNTVDHMKALGASIAEKFKIAEDALESLAPIGIAEWTKPRGGYFISLNVLPGTARRVYDLMREMGVVLTKVGATFPHGIDPEDKNLRLAPTYPSHAELEMSMQMLCVAIRLAAAEHFLAAAR